MDPDETSGSPSVERSFPPASSVLIFLGFLALIVGAALAYRLLRSPASPPPVAIANDPLLVEGRSVYLYRCVSCHGESGRGDGPIAKGLSGPPVGDLTDATWKHGDRAEQVLGVVTRGVRDTTMPGWEGTLIPRELRAVSAYVYHLAGRAVPDPLRDPRPASGP